jgi:hypothetical protein
VAQPPKAIARASIIENAKKLFFMVSSPPFCSVYITMTATV